MDVFGIDVLNAIILFQKNNTEFWKKKFERNQARDLKKNKRSEKIGLESFCFLGNVI